MLTLALVVLLSKPPDVAALKVRVDETRDALNAHQPGAPESIRKLKKELEAAARANDASPELLLLLGRAALYAEEPEEAALTFDRALTLAPKLADLHFYRGIAAQHTNALGVAEKHFATLTTLEPSAPRGWLELGRTRYAMQKDAEAEAALRKALALDPKVAGAHGMLGNLLMGQGKSEEAIKQLEAAIALDARDLQATYNAGQYYQLNGKPQLALARFKTVAAADPDDWHVRAKLVQLHQALGDVPARDQARKEVFALQAAGKVEAKFTEYCREQFEAGGVKVMAFESFALTGERAVRYAFRVVGADGKLSRVISLGSYDFTTSYMRESGQLKPDERAWHLDGYRPDGSHQTFGIYTREPGYEQTRAWVVEVLEDKLKAQSGTSAPAPAKGKK